MQREFVDIVYRYRNSPMYVLRHRTRNPVNGMQKRLEAREYDDMPDDQYDAMRDEVEHLARLWHRQTTVHPDTLLGRLIIESAKDPELPVLFKRYEHLMSDEYPGLER